MTDYSHLAFDISINSTSAFSLALWAYRMRVMSTLGKDNAHFHALFRKEAAIPVPLAVDVPFSAESWMTNRPSQFYQLLVRSPL
jgi:hypothetical protein